MHAVRFVVHNTGWLPTNVTEQALKMKAVRPLEVDVALPEGAQFVNGEAKTILGQLAGRNGTWAFSGWGAAGTEERAKVEWVIQAPPGTEIQIVATHQRAGTVRATINLVP
jgi:hypothetical protein